MTTHAPATCCEDNDKGEDKERDPAYLVIDYGEQLLRDLEDTRDELQKEVVSLVERTTLLWEVLASYMILVTPVTAMLVLVAVVHFCLPSALATTLETLLVSLTVGFVFLTLTPMSEALTNYQDHVLYNPAFRSCDCERCAGRREKKVTSQEPVAKGTGQAADTDVASQVDNLGQATAATPDGALVVD